MSEWKKHPEIFQILPAAENGMLERIQNMNEVFNLPSNSTPTDLGRERLEAFMRVFKDEVDELNDVYTYEDGRWATFDKVALADCFGDLFVYLMSECCRWGIPIVPVFHAIMDSQDSKLVNGKPVMAPDGSKFIKGPNYEPPEARIKEILD